MDAFNALKTNFTELEKKYGLLMTEKTKLEKENKRKSEELESAQIIRKDLEDKISTLQSDLDAATKDSDILEKELLGKYFSLFSAIYLSAILTCYLDFYLPCHCRTIGLSYSELFTFRGRNFQISWCCRSRVDQVLPEHM